MQLDAGRYFIHEHPASATSWGPPSVMQLLNTHGILKTTVHMCAYGMTSQDEHGKGLVYKPTSFATNSPHVATCLNRKCSNTCGYQKHRHVHLINGRAKLAQVYPSELCRAMCQGIYDQKQDDKKGVYLIGSVEAPKTMKASSRDTKNLKLWRRNVMLHAKKIQKQKDLRQRKAQNHRSDLVLISARCSLFKTQETCMVATI